MSQLESEIYSIENSSFKSPSKQSWLYEETVNLKYQSQQLQNEIDEIDHRINSLSHIEFSPPSADILIEKKVKLANLNDEISKL